MKDKESALVLSAIELTKVGECLDNARGELKRQAESGISYESDDMKDALEACLTLELQWKTLEQRHLALRKEVM
ncbi:MAG: hypothetical protein ACI3V2_03555 [Faecousia sp.]